ncbi:hypothetical protein GOV14_03560 [Candidatus Pacearchaeota archaeon]|nr:hypothetical protein [Candidatus Pacearchaeota archaeon]
MEKLNKILELITSKLKGLNYAFIGSISVKAQGVKEIKPRDIDILTTPEELKTIVEKLKEHQTKEVYFDESNGRNSYRTFFEIDGIEIEVLGNVNNVVRSKNSLDKKIIVKHDDLELSCLPLKEEITAYEKMGRKDKADMIKNFLDD